MSHPLGLPHALSSGNSGGLYHQDAGQASTTLQEPYCTGIPSRNTGQDGIRKTNSLEKPMPKIHSKGGEMGTWGMGPLSLVFSHLPKDPITVREEQSSTGGWQGNNVLVCRQGKTSNKASKADSSWKANSEGNDHETGSAAAWKKGTVRRGKERPPLS